MKTKWPERTSELNTVLSDLRSGIPAAFKAFSTLAQTATAPNALDGRTKELIALSIAVAIRCDDLPPSMAPLVRRLSKLSPWR